jgi:hypothetical protein
MLSKDNLEMNDPNTGAHIPIFKIQRQRTPDSSTKTHCTLGINSDIFTETPTTNDKDGLPPSSVLSRSNKNRHF